MNVDNKGIILPRPVENAVTTAISGIEGFSGNRRADASTDVLPVFLLAEPLNFLRLFFLASLKEKLSFAISAIHSLVAVLCYAACEEETDLILDKLSRGYHTVRTRGEKRH